MSKQFMDITGLRTFLSQLKNLFVTKTELNNAENRLQEQSTQISNAVSSKQDKITGAATTVTDTNLTASRAIVSNSSGKIATSEVTSTELGYLDGVTSNIQAQLNNKSNASHTHDPKELRSGYMTSQIYINSHPENSPAIVPFIYNDLAFLNKKGGSSKIYSTTDTDYTKISLTEGTLSVSGFDSVFDGSPSYAMISTTGDFTAVIDLTLHKLFTYNNVFYIDFGSTSWKVKNIAVYVMNSSTETSYTLKNSITNHSLANWYTSISHSSTNSSGSTVQGFNKLRIVLSNFNNTTSTSGKRISQIGLINYGSAGVTETFISRGGCSGIYGNLIPHNNNAYSLGSSGKKWSNIYATTFNGALSGNASTATKATQDASGNVIASTYATKDELNNVIDAKVDKVTGKGLSTNDYTTSEKNKLAGIAEGANKTIVDGSLSTTSTNPVQNKIVNEALNNKLSTAGGTMTGAIAMGGNKITNLDTPVENTDAVNKEYADQIRSEYNTFIRNEKFVHKNIEYYYIGGENASDDNPGTENLPFATIDKFFSVCNEKGCLEARCWINPDPNKAENEETIYNVNYNVFCGTSFHIKANSNSKIVLNFVNPRTSSTKPLGEIVFYGTHYNFNGITLRATGEFRFETSSVGLTDAIFEAGSFVNFLDCFVLGTNTTFPKVKFSGSRGTVNGLICTHKISDDISIDIGRGADIEFTGRLTVPQESETSNSTLMRINSSTVKFNFTDFVLPSINTNKYANGIKINSSTLYLPSNARSQIENGTTTSIVYGDGGSLVVNDGNGIRCFGSLKDIGITTFPTTMSVVAEAMPNNSMIVIDTRTIMSGGAEEISDWGLTINGTAYINKGYSTARVTMMVLYGSSEAKRGRILAGCWASETNAVSWMDYGFEGNEAYPGCIARDNNGTAEWVNPPMVAGTEYRTTERFLGKPVYRKLISCGNLPGAGSTKSISHGAAASQIVKVIGCIAGGDSIPFYDSSNGDIRISASKANVKITTVSWNGSTDITGKSAYAQIWYTKD